MKQTAQDYFVRGLQFCQDSKFDQAVKVLGQAIELEPTHLAALYNRAKAYFKLNSFDLAISLNL